MSVAVASLQARRREKTGKGVARRLRRAGRIPAVVYGKDMEPIPLSLDEQEAVLLFESIPVANTVLQLDIGGGETLRTLVREIQTHPFRPDVIHVDFMHLRRGIAVELNVPISLSGTPAGTRSGGRLDIAVHEAHVRCTPARIPESIHADISELEIGESLRLGDLALPEDVELLSGPDTLVCHIATSWEPEDDEEEELEVGEVEEAGEDVEES
ncbi:MAG: 50S ribosomal protein L25 [Gammaproteobacteria bacterium]|nr:50S ribosomal protein L25 [Gammaproteobacteria bacterium]